MRGYCSISVCTWNLKVGCTLSCSERFCLIGEARCNAVFTATLKRHQPGTGYNRIKTREKKFRTS